jgi:micrococcal nuclease
MRNTFAVVVLALVGYAAAADAVATFETFPAEVVGVSDGDTLTVIDSAKVQTKIRLHGIDAPEAKQAFGARAKEALSAKVFGKQVRIERRDVDRYGRTVANVIIGDRIINREMVADGFAWHYVKYAPNDAELAAAEKSAREKKLGIWSDAAPIAPWDYRKPPERPELVGMAYMNATGERYHRANCRHLNASAKAVPLAEAMKSRTPCKACRPDAAR